jgi:hypothetical protein
MPTRLADLRLASQQRADRVNAVTISTAEWNAYINASNGELYGTICSTYQDYNVKSQNFTLAGGSPTGNTVAVGPAQSVAPDFYQPRKLQLQLASSIGGVTPFITIPRINSFMEQDLYTFPNIVPVYGSIPSGWNLVGNLVTVHPPSTAGAQYVLWYVPTAPTLVNDDDTIDAFWLSVNGWHEYVILDVAAKALIKEESLDTAQLLLQQKEQLRQRIIREAMPRDVSQPQNIVDMQRIRNNWGNGLPGAGPPGWGGDWGGGGTW